MDFPEEMQNVFTIDREGTDGPEDSIQGQVY